MVTTRRQANASAAASEASPPPQEENLLPSDEAAPADYAVLPFARMPESSQDPPGDVAMVDSPPVDLAADLDAEDEDLQKKPAAVDFVPQAMEDIPEEEDSVESSTTRTVVEACSVATSRTNRTTGTAGTNYVQIVPGIAERVDSYPLPTLKENQKWEWVPRPGTRLVIMKDAALAAGNAIKEVWEDEEVLFGTCAWHAGSHWMEDTGKKYLKKQDNKYTMKKDLEDLKNCSYAHLVTIYTEAMLYKWEHVLEEKTVSEKWRFWVNHDSVMTR